MDSPHLRVRFGSETSRQKATDDGGQRVTVPLRDIALTLADAVNCGRIWVKDFENEELTLSSDLYEVLLAYQHYYRPSA